MVDPYKMIVVNLIASALVLTGTFVYRFIYPKKKINLFILLLLISILPIISIFRSGVYESGDLALHTMRTMSFYNSLFVEHILPRWTPEFSKGYGDPYFMFAYFLPYFIGSVLHFIGFSFINSIKLLLALSFVLSGVFMFYFVKDELGEKSAFVSSIFYLFTPYHLIDMHFRVSIAEVLSFIFLPLSLYLAKKIITTKNINYIFLESIALALFILSHQIISLSFFPTIILYGIFVGINDKTKEIGKYLRFLSSVFLGLLISGFYWLPILLESKYTQTAIKQATSIAFYPINDLLFSPWRYGFLFQGHMGEISHLIGYTQVFVIILSIILVFKKNIPKILRKKVLFFLIPTVFLIFMILPISKSLWDKIPFAYLFQFSYRLLLPISFFIAVLAGLATKIINKNYFIFLLCGLTIFYTILNWGNRGMVYATDDTLRKEFSLRSDVIDLEPSSPIWANVNKNLYAKKRVYNIEILSGNADAKQTFRNSTDHEYLVNVKSNSVSIKENTLFFPGWTLTVDNKIQNFSYQNAKYPGVIIFNLNKGQHNVALKFLDTPIRYFSMLISKLTIVIILLFFLLYFLRNTFNSSKTNKRNYYTFNFEKLRQFK